MHEQTALTWADLIEQVRETVLDPTEDSHLDDVILRYLERGLLEMIGRLDHKCLPRTVREALVDFVATPPSVVLPDGLVQLVEVGVRYDASDAYAPANILQPHREGLIHTNPLVQGTRENPIVWSRGTQLYISPALDDVVVATLIEDGIKIEYMEQPDRVTDLGTSPPVSDYLAGALVEFAASRVALSDRNLERAQFHRGAYDGILLGAASTVKQDGRVDTGYLDGVIKTLRGPEAV